MKLDEGAVWIAIFFIGLWLGQAVLQTSLGRNDRRPWPINWWQTLAAWSAVSLPPVLGLAIWFNTSYGADHPSRIYAAMPALGTASWFLAPHLPVVGKWVRALRTRQELRRDRGLL
jgi:hypothetical protein